MLCERVLGNIRVDSSQYFFPIRTRDDLEIHWWEADRRALRRNTRGGREIRVLLPLGQNLADGDVLFDDGATLVVLQILPSNVLVVRPRDMTQMGIVALVVGNLHAPAEIVDAEVLIAPDGPVELALNDLGIGFERQIRSFRPRRCAGMPALSVSPEFEVR